MKHVKLFEEFDRVEESHEDLENYMFFSNLESIKRKCESILSRDFKAIDELLNEGGHDWAADHVAVAKENIDQVESFLTGHFEDPHRAEDLQGVSESKESDSLKKEIVKAMIKIDDSMSYEDFASAVASVLKEEYGSHNFKPFVSSLQKDLGI